MQVEQQQCDVSHAEEGTPARAAFVQGSQGREWQWALHLWLIEFLTDLSISAKLHRGQRGENITKIKLWSTRGRKYRQEEG